MNNIKNDIAKLATMREDLYQIISNISAMNEVCQASQNDDRVYLWRGEFYEVTEYGTSEYCELKLYVLAKTEEEAEVRLKARADEEYNDYEFYVYKVDEDENGIIELD
jgi:hypothetical protein